MRIAASYRNPAAPRVPMFKSFYILCILIYDIDRRTGRRARGTTQHRPGRPPPTPASDAVVAERGVEGPATRLVRRRDAVPPGEHACDHAQIQV